MNIRRSAAALAAAAAIGATATPAAFAATPSSSSSSSPSASPSPSPSGLFGTADPKYDGVWRQSLALLAQHTVGLKPAGKAVEWLAGQQCANGGFTAYRADTSRPCDAEAVLDTNATAAAIQALAALGGHRAETTKAVKWLESVQNKDGGWGYAPGGPSDTNSTSVVIGALAAAGEDPGNVRKAGASPYDLLTAWSIACDRDGGGGLAYQPGKKGELTANADATAAGVLGALGKGFVTTAGKAPADGYACAGAENPTRAEAARNGSAYLSGAMKTGYLKSVLPGAKDQPDYGNTADAVVALAAQGWTEPAQRPYGWLRTHAVKWAEQSGPAAWAQLILTAHAMGGDPRDFGGTNLVDRLNATGPAPGTNGSSSPAAAKKATKDSAVSVWWIVGVGLVGGIGVGFLLSGRRKR